MILFVDDNVGVLLLKRIVIPIEPLIESVPPVITPEIIGEIFSRSSKSIIEFKKMTDTIEQFSDQSRVVLEINPSSLVISVYDSESEVDDEYIANSISMEEFKKISKIL